MKLPTLLKALQKEEHKEFEKFLQSPFFKASEQYLKFFRHLCKHHPRFEVERTDLEVAYRSCFGQQSLTDSKLYNLLSGLGRQVEQYLAVKMVLDSDGKDESQLQRELLVKSLGQRNMGAYFRVEAQRLIDEVGAMPAKALEDYITLEQLHHLVYFNPDTPKYKEHPPSLPLAMENLDLYYCIAKLRYAAEMKMRERLFQARYELPLLEAVLDKTAAPELVKTHPLAALYNRLVHLYIGGVGEQDFRALRLLFTEKFHLLPKEDQQLLLQHLINSGISLIAQDCELHEEMLSLYKMAIEADMLLDGNRITNPTFANIVAFAALCKEFDWAKTFMHRFSPFLEADKRQSAISLSESSLYYGQGMLDKAQSSLIAETFMFPAFDIVARGLLLKILFDRYVQKDKDYEYLNAHLNAFEKFINIKQLTEEKKNAQLNCIRFVRKMAALKFELVDVPEKRKKSLRSKLKQLKPIVSKKWLEEKIESL